jgi:signal transduction protein with GAF and PtsI domain
MSHSSINKVKWVLRSFRRDRAQALAREALAMSGPGPVRELVNNELECAGLGGLVRAGR